MTRGGIEGTSRLGSTQSRTRSFASLQIGDRVAPGTLVGGTYRLGRVIGEGAMGIVMHAVDERLQREVAVKFVQEARAGHAPTREQFVREARIMARIRHENLVGIHAFGELDGVPYFVMEYVAGIDLRRWMDHRVGSPFALDEILGVVDQLARGVGAIHAAGAVHLDLKPSNILVGSGFRVVVTDLGLARSQAEHPSRHRIVGTPAYIAPEVAGQRPLAADLACAPDVYALGVITFELLTGQLPFSSTDTMMLLEQHIGARPPRPSDLRPELPCTFDEVVLRALEKDPGRRTPSVAMFRRQLFEARERMAGLSEPIELLIADDDEECRLTTREVLRRAMPSARVHTTTDGNEALERAVRCPPDILVTDLDMPGLNGIELAAALRSRRKTRDVAVVVTTGVGGASDWKLLRQLGARAFLVKPFGPEVLLSTVRRIARSRRGAAGDG